MAINSFLDLNLDERSLKSLADLKYEVPTPIQIKAIPEVLAGKDIMAQAQTGTGKTAAFALPTIERLKNEKKVQILVLTPTRELSQQVSLEFEKLGKYHHVKTATIVGGKSYRDQFEQLRHAQVLVATPGRLVDLLESGKIKDFAPTTVILDEADKMLDMGFAEALEVIFSFLPKERQTLLFSATFPVQIQKLAKKIQKPDAIKIKIETTSETSLDIDQSFFVVKDLEKDESLFRLIQFYQPAKALIFCEMKRDADRLGSALLKKGFSASILHGDTEQRRREEILHRFKTAKKSLLVATDLAARGLDVHDLSHVINFQIPWSVESYVHRIGRTGRAGQKGVAFSLVSKAEAHVIQKWAFLAKSQIRFKEIPKLTQLKMQNLKSLATDLEKSAVSTETLVMLKELEKQIPLVDLAAKLLERSFAKADLTGPEKLGMSEAEFADRSRDVKKSGFERSRPPQRASREGRPSRGGQEQFRRREQPAKRSGTGDGYRSSDQPTRSGGGAGKSVRSQYHDRRGKFTSP